MMHYIEHPLREHLLRKNLQPRVSIKIFATICLLMSNFSSNAAGIDATINAAMTPITEAVAGFIFFEVNIFGNQIPLIILWLISAAIFFTFYFKFFESAWF